MPPNLSLPTHAPELGQYTAYNRDDAAFALYTLTPHTTDPLQDIIASSLESQWLAQGNATHLVQPAPSPPAPQKFNNTLKDIVKAHIALDKINKTRRNDESNGSTAGAAGDLKWWPTAFIVLVREDWKTTPPGGQLLFVFADEERGCEMDKFFFRLEDAYMMLSSLSFGDEGLGMTKEIYGQECRD